MDELRIQGLRVNTKIGIYKWEQQINQLLLIDITIPTNFAETEEDINQTINYATLCKTITDFVENKSFQLIETVANEVASLIKQQFQASQVTVGVNKPHAISNASAVQVIITR